ncbi:MAG: aldehyde dehydrogenase family protein [Sulfuricaulis sp.]|nr:aldehyde dehydrogenase family protein [Sulfuricaulis sp.]
MDTQLFIDNADVAATGDATFARHDPVTGEIATRAAAATVHDAKAAADVASAAFPAWSATGPTERIVVDEAVADSCIAKFAARAVIEEFTELRWITIELTPRH